MFRGAAAAGLSIALCLVAAPAAAVTAASTPAAKASPSSSPSTGAGHKSSHTSGSGHSQGGAGASGSFAPAQGNIQLPGPTQQCDPSVPSPPQSTPWAQQALDYASAWNFTKGAGVTVAVIDSGVDANPKFGNRVSVGPTFASATTGAAQYADCAGHGTMVAGIVAAAPGHGNAFAGVAPDANILSIKVAGGQNQGSPDTFSGSAVVNAINYAVASHVQVINLSLTISPPTPQLEAAVENAISQNIVVVASAGNDKQVTNADGTTTTTHGPFFPADYPGVLSVGAWDGGTGGLWAYSDTKTHVSVTAPGADVTSTFPGTTGDAYAADSGTSFAAPFVSGVAALVRSRYPHLTAPQVVRRIEETADGSAGSGTGFGLVNPLEAVTAGLPAGAATAAPAGPGKDTGAVTVDHATPNRSEETVALSLAGGAFAVALLVIAAAVVIPAGRRRRWRPGQPS